MTYARLLQVYAGILLTVFGLIVVHAPLSVGFGTLLPDYADLIKAWKEILLTIAIMIALSIATYRRLWPRLLKDWLVRISLLYALLHLALLVWMPQGMMAAVSGLMIDLRYVAYFLCVFLLMLVAPQFRALFIKVGIVGVAIVIGFGALQLLLPPDILKHIGYDKETTIAPYLTVDQNEAYVRINSTLRGPNPLGAYAVIVLGLLTAAAVRKEIDWRRRKDGLIAGAAAALSGLVLWVSYSRSALVAAVMTVGLAAGVGFAARLPLRKVVMASMVALLLLMGGLYSIRDTSFYAHVITHENPQEGNAVNSNDGHIDSLYMGVERMSTQPLGAGIGSTGSASLYTDQPVIIENQYLFVAHESGWLGLALFMGLYGGILWRLWRCRDDWLALGVFASGVGLAAIGLLLPVWVDDTVSIVWWGLAAIVCGASARPRQS